MGPLALHSLVRHRVRKQRALFADQLAQHLEELASAMRAGHGLVAGLTAVARSAPEPSKDEWARVIADERLGMPIDVAMQSLAARMESTEVEQVALIASLHNRTGGNIAEVLDRLAEAVRERAELRRELGALTAQARLSRWVVTLLPPGVLGVVAIVNPNYLQPLFNTPTGNVVLAIAVTMLVAGSLVMRAMTEIKV
jgi:tight adherence protein B